MVHAPTEERETDSIMDSAVFNGRAAAQPSQRSFAWDKQRPRLPVRLILELGIPVATSPNADRWVGRMLEQNVRKLMRK